MSDEERLEIAKILYKVSNWNSLTSLGQKPYGVLDSIPQRIRKTKGYKKRKLHNKMAKMSRRINQKRR